MNHPLIKYPIFVLRFILVILIYWTLSIFRPATQEELDERIPW